MNDTFSWSALRDQLRESPWLRSEDDLTTQRGIVAAATAVLERMSIETRETSWTPHRVLAKRQRETAAAVAQMSRATGRPDDDGGVKVAPAATPRLPRPGGMAVLPGELLGNRATWVKDADPVEW